MNKVLSIAQAIKLSANLRHTKKRIVLAGGCFDILHSGHIAFLKTAKGYADALIVLLESDEKIQRLKGKNRPVNSQKRRAQILAAIPQVDYIALLPPNIKDLEYDTIVLGIKPAIIATTKGDRHRFHKERQAKLINSSVIDVIEQIPEKSTTRLVRELLKRDKL